MSGSTPFVYQLMTLLAMRSTACVSDEATAGAGDEASDGDNVCLVVLCVYYIE